MKKFFFIVFLCGIVLFSGSIYAQKTTAKTEQGVSATDILRYTNAVKELNELYTQPLNNIEEVLSIAGQNIQKVNQGADVQQLSTIDCNKLSVSKEDVAKYQSQLKSVSAFEGKNEIAASMKQGIDNCEQIAGCCEKMNGYFANASYKVDSGYVKYLAIVNDLYASIRQAYVGWGNAVSLASKIGDKAETEILSKSKMGEFILPMKTDLVSLNEVFNLLQKDDVDVPGMQQMLKSIQESCGKNENLSDKDVSKLSARSKELYTSFYGKMNDCISSVYTIVDIKGKRKAVEKDFDNEEEQEQAFLALESNNSEMMDKAFFEAKNKYNAVNEDYKAFLELNK